MGKYPCCQTISEVNLEPVSSIAAAPPPVMKGEASLAVACFHRWAVDPECGWWMNMEVPTPRQLFDQDSELVMVVIFILHISEPTSSECFYHF